MKKIIFIIVSFSFIIILLFPSHSYIEREVMIGALQWKIFIPQEDFWNKCFVYVHGDGQMDIDAMWFYHPNINEFAKQWYCSMSWEKWKDYKSQSMSDRAREVEEAIAVLKNNIQVEKIYVIWWSQSAWVLPYIDQNNINAFIQVSGAVDWLSQWEYMTQIRSQFENWPSERLERQVTSDKKFNTFLSSWMRYEEYIKTVDFEEVWEENWRFWQTNYTEDIRNTYQNITIPYLAIFGWNDAHVDAEFSRKIYPEALKNVHYEELYYEQANHSMIQTSQKEFVHEWLSSIKNYIKHEFWWTSAYPDGYFKNILDFTWKY
jgi:esterase/lipase